jgi:hypothetical protein
MGEEVNRDGEQLIALQWTDGQQVAKRTGQCLWHK